MAFPILPLAIGAVALVTILATKGSSRESGGRAGIDGDVVRCGDAMSPKLAEVFDKEMSLPRAKGTSSEQRVKFAADAYDEAGFHNAAHCLRVHHGV